MRPDSAPLRDLTSIGQQVLNDVAPSGRLLDLEEVLPVDPPVGDGLVPAPRAPSLPDDHVEAVVLEVQGLSRSLNAISENRDGLIREALAGFVQGPLVSSDHVFQLVAKLNLCHVSCAFVCSRRRSRAFCRT